MPSVSVSELFPTEKPVHLETHRTVPHLLRTGGKAGSGYLHHLPKDKNTTSQMIDGNNSPPHFQFRFAQIIWNSRQEKKETISLP